MKRRALELAGIIRRYDLLKEGEDDTADDLFGDDSGDDSGDEDADDEGGGDTDEGEDEGEEDKEEEEEEPVESLSPDEIAKYGPGEIEKVIDEKMEEFFISSQKSAQVRTTQSVGYPGEEQELGEGFIHRNSLSSLLLENEEDQDVTQDIDITSFTSDVWRLMSNYETLLDMEGMIFTKAKQFLMNQLDAEAADLFEELLALRHGWDPEEKYDGEGTQNVNIAPPAAGAISGGGAA